MSSLAIDDGDVRIWYGDVVECLRQLPDGIVQTCVTSPPYWGLRDYGDADQIGLEPTPEEYVARIVEVFREVRRMLRDDGTLWLNLGDSYFGTGKNPTPPTGIHGANGTPYPIRGTYSHEVLKPKDLVGMPWRVAFALQADGWYLRSDIIWAKLNPMPESITDRPTKSHEYVFLLSKSARYYYDIEAIREPVSTRWEYAGGAPMPKHGSHVKEQGHRNNNAYRVYDEPKGANARTVWRIATKPYAEAHFATFPIELPERCIKAGSREGDTVLDPFMGSGTTAYVARHLNRHAIGVELNADYITIARKRLAQQSLFAEEHRAND